jgi:NADH dehydrogenase
LNERIEALEPGKGRRVFVTGGAGVMGARLVRSLIAAGWRVRALVLPGDPLRARLEDSGAEVVEGDVADAASLRGLCADVDTVYHLAAIIIAHDDALFSRVNRDGTANVVLEARASGVRHFIYVSSASVTYPLLTAYGRSKLEAEEIVRAAGNFAYTIVRPTLVYDETGGQEFLMFLRYLQRFPVVPFIGKGRALKRPVWSGDVVDGLLRLCGNPLAHGKTYNLSGGEAIEIKELARLMLRHHGGEKPFLSLPVSACRALSLILGAVMARPPLNRYVIAGMVNDADLDPAEATRDLGYRPLGVREGLARCFPTAEGTPS